ncbi:ATP-dependent nuclease, subunit A [Minicystis rosea]|nr:ATP-dependent nuclease, subunit A [Minicystis rosea]
MSSAAPPLPTVSSDEIARVRICEDLTSTLVVEAAAGTGKTTMLVARIIAVLRAGLADLDRIVAVTFTEKAAGEMKLRLRAGLEKARNDPATTAAEMVHLDRALAHLEVARIGTIHSLCADLLREFPVEARVDPLFEVTPEEEAERLFESCFETWFQQTLRRPTEGVRRILRRRARGRDRVGPREALRDAAWKLIGHRDFTRPWRRDPFDRAAAIDEAVVELSAFAELCARADELQDEYLGKALDPVRRFVDELNRRERVRARDYDGLEAELAELLRARQWSWRLGGGRGPRAEIAARREVVRAKLTTTLERAGADLAACLHHELRPLADQYADLKARAGKLDFLDLLLRARDLVRHGQAVRAELQARFARIFVDEFQDTDPLQAEILLLLSADDPACGAYLDVRPAPGKLFVVGDPKQSIYRFRRADVQLYESIKERLVARGASLLYLTRSFRSAPPIQDAVNASFSKVMTGNGQAAYVALENHRPAIADQPAVVVLPVPRPYGDWGKVAEHAIRDSLPDAVGAFVDWVVNQSGWMVTERENPETRVPIGARHVCLLFKRFQGFGDDVTRAYVRALEARRVPHVLVGGRSFYDREEVQAVRNALVAIEWPDDELSVYATLRGPFFALSDDALLAYREASGDGAHLGPIHPLHVLGTSAPLPHDEDGSLAEVAEALTILRKLHLGRNRRPIADTIEQLLSATRAHAGIAIWPTGEQALANVLRVMDLARRFEAQGATSFRAFVDWLDAGAESGTAGEAPVVEEGTEGVRIMTVHRAKGLEFPVVILADPTAPVAFSQPTRHVETDGGLWAEALAGCVPIELIEHREEVLQRDREEGTRLAYVAATRARDLLVVPAVGDAPFEGWLSVLDPVVYPEPRSRRRPEAAPGCPPFGDDSVLERPPRVERDAASSVAPGLHRPGKGLSVVWWDPAALGLGKEPEGGLRQQRILAADTSNLVSEEGVVAHRAWAEARIELLVRGAHRTLSVRTVSEIVEKVTEPAPAAWTTREADPAPDLVVELADSGVDRRGRPHGKRFGTLVHAVLAAVALDADEATIDAVARAEGRLAGASVEEVAAAATAAKIALQHPLMRRAAESEKRGECRRETPVMLPGRGGELIEGIVDLAFRESGPSGAGWVVVDFKTDAEIAGRKARYETQVLLYVEAIRAATGEGARGVLLSV